MLSNSSWNPDPAPSTVIFDSGVRSRCLGRKMSSKGFQQPSTKLLTRGLTLPEARPVLKFKSKQACQEAHELTHAVSMEPGKFRNQILTCQCEILAAKQPNSRTKERRKGNQRSKLHSYATDHWLYFKASNQRQLMVRISRSATPLAPAQPT